MGSKRDAFEKKYGGGAPAATAVAPPTANPKPAASKRAAFEAKYGAATPSQAMPSPASPEPVSEFLPQMRMPEMPQPYEYTPGPGSVRALEVAQQEASQAAKGYVMTPTGTVPVPAPIPEPVPGPAAYAPDPRLLRSERLMGEATPRQPATPAPLPPEAIPADYQYPYDARQIAQDLSDFIIPPQTLGAAKLGVGVAGAALAGINNRLRQGESDALKSERAGYGDAVAGLGSAAQYAGDPALAGGLKIAGAAMQDAAKGVQTPEYQGLSSLADPQYLATRGVRTVAGSVPLMAAGMGVGGAATAAAGPLVGSLIGAAVSRPIESATEAGQTYEDALKQGMSEADARSAANRTFWLNNALVVTDAGELFTALAPLPAPLRKILGVGTKESVSAMQRAAMGLLKTGLTAGQEGLEEGAQTAIQRTSLGKPVEWDKEMQESILLGGAMGGLMGAGGAVMEGGQAGPKPAPTPAQPAPVVEQPKVQNPGQTPGQITPVQPAPVAAQPQTAPDRFAGPEGLNNKALFVDGKILFPGDVEAAAGEILRSGFNSDPSAEGVLDRGHDTYYLVRAIREGDPEAMQEAFGYSGVHITRLADQTLELRHDVDGFLRQNDHITQKQYEANLVEAVRALKKEDFTGPLSIPEVGYKGTVEDFLENPVLKKPATGQRPSRPDAEAIWQKYQRGETWDGGLPEPALTVAGALKQAGRELDFATFTQMAAEAHGIRNSGAKGREYQQKLLALVEKYKTAPRTPALDRAALLREQNPGMDEKAIMDMVKTTGNLSDAEFQAFAERAGKPEAAPAPNTPPSPQEPASGPVVSVATAPLPSGQEGGGASQTEQNGQQTKQPWQMTKTEFQGNVLYRGKHPGQREGGNLYWTDTLETAQFYSVGPVEIIYKSDVPADYLNYGDNAQPGSIDEVLAHTGSTRGLREVETPATVKSRAEVPSGVDPHKHLVERALSEGKPVPASVLADYSDLASKAPTTPTAPQGDTTGRTPAPAPAGKQTAPPRKDPAGIAGSTFKHFTTPEGKAALESGQPFDFAKEPQHGTGDFSKGPKTGKMAGNRLYLSLDDGRWGKVDKETGKGQVVEATEANEKKYGDKAKAFFDYDKQKWMLNVGGHEQVTLNPVEYQITPDARVLVIDSEQKLTAAAAEASVIAKRKVYTQDDTMLWDALAKKYDVIAIRNAKKITEATDNKFFRAAGSDQLIVLNPAVATVVNTAQKAPAKAQAAVAKTDPAAWKSLIMNPADPKGLAALEAIFKEAGKPVPQKVKDLLTEQTALLKQRPTEATRADMARVSGELEQAVTNGLKEETKTPMERVLSGEEATPLTGKKLPPGALEGKTEKSNAETPAPPKAQQGTLFDESATDAETEQQDQLAAYQTELAEIQEGHRAARVKWDTAVEDAAVKAAKQATADNDKQRAELWALITTHGHIGPSKSANEDHYKRLSKKVNHLKRKDGIPLDELYTTIRDAGFTVNSADELVGLINGYAEAGKVDPRDKWTETEYYFEATEAGAALKAELDFYRQAEEAVQAAITELEGESRGGKAEANQRLNSATGAQETAAAGGTGAAVSGAGEGNGQGSKGRGSKASGEAAVASATDKAVDDAQAMAAPGQILGSTPPTASKGKVQRIEIVRHFSRGLGIPIRTGRFMAKALGIFKIRSEAIRTKLAEDLRTITHEVGHYLDKRLKLADPQFDAELIPLGQPTSRASYTQAQVRAEGVAEFTNLYLTDKAQAQNQASGFFAHFEQALATDKKLRRVIAEGQDMLHVYVSQNATDMVKSGISYTPPKEGWTWDRLKKIGLDLYEAWTDKHDPLMVAEKKMNKGQRASNRLSPFAQATLARGWEGLAKKFLETGAQRYNHTTQAYETVGPSLDAILEPIGDKLDDFAAYSAAMRALYLAKTRGWDDTRLPFPLWAARDTVRQYSSPEFAKALKQLQKFQDAVLDHYAEAGFLTKAQLAQIRAANKVYVPYLREQVEEGPGMRQILGPKYANVSNAVVKMKGGTGTVINPLHSIVHNTFKLINLAERNKTGVLLADLADTADGAGNVIEDVTKSFKPATFSLEQIKDVLNAELAASGEDVDTLGMDMSAMATVFSPNTMPTGGDAAKGIFSVYRNGKTKFYQAEPDLYRALTALDKPALNAVFKALSYHTQLKRTFAVVTPEFIMRNFGRDALTSGIYGRGLPLEAHMRGFVAQIFNKEAVTRWEAGGGFASSMVSPDRDYQAETIKGLVAKHKLLKENLLPPWRALQNLSEFIERAPKVGEMLMAEEGSALEHKLFGLGKGAVDTRSGILESKDLNLDFGRSGNLGQQWNSITAFFNAWMQDVDKFVRAHTNPKTAVRVITRGVMFITMPTFLLWLRNKDDEEYQEFPQWKKDLFWNFKLGDRWYMWPAPHMLALAYKAIPERIFNAIHQGSTAPFTKDLLGTVEALAGPNTIPDALALLAELRFNWNFFGDRPIVPRGEERKEPAQQFGPYTSETAKRVGAAIEVSPRKVEQAVRGTLAGGGGYLLAGADKALELYDQAAGKPLPPEKSARESTFVRAFSSKNPLASGSQSIDDFYRAKEQHDVLWNSLPGRAGIFKPLGEYSEYDANGNPKWKTAEKAALAKVVQNLTDEERKLIGPDFTEWRKTIKPGLNKLEKQLGDLSKLKQVIERSSKTPEQKRRDIDTLERQRLNLARGALGKPLMPK